MCKLTLRLILWLYVCDFKHLDENWNFFSGKYLTLQIKGIQIFMIFSNNITNLVLEFKMYVTLKLEEVLVSM